MLEILIGNTLAAACLALLVLLFCRLGRPGPATRHALWFLIVLKLLSPVGLLWQETLPFDRPHFLNDERSQTHLVNAAASKPEVVPELHVFVAADPLDDARAMAFEPAKSELNIEPPAALEYSVRSSQYSDPNSSARLRESLYLWILIIWLAGALVVAARYAHRTVHFARYARTGKPASQSLQRQVEELAAMLGVSAPRVRVLPDLPSPVVWSLFRPALLWPKGLQDLLSNEGRRAVLVHELAHLVRKDHWFRWLELAAAVVHWWNPLFWLARRQMRFQAELACDAWVTGTLPDDRRAYAEALLEVCARTTRAAAPSPAVGVGGEGRRDFQRRLTMIMRDRVPCRLAAGAKMFMVLLAIAALPAWTLGQAKREPMETPKVEVEIDKDADLKTFDFEAFPYSLTELTGALTGDFELVLVDGQPDEQKIKELQARIAELTKQLKAINDAKAAAEKAKTAQPFAFRLMDLKGPEPIAVEQKIKIILIGPDGKAIELGGDGAALPDVLKWVPKAVEAKPSVATTEVKRTRILRIDSNGKVIEVEEPKPTTPNPEVKPLPKAHAQSIRVEVVNTDGKQPQVKIIGADGKEIKDVKILIDRLQLPGVPATPAMKSVPVVRPIPAAPAIAVPGRIELKLDEAKKAEAARGRFVEMQPAPTPIQGARAVTLSRATYKLPKDKAESLSAFLKANVKASVLELKIDDSGLTVTTTPEAQTTISGLVNLMQTSGGDGLKFQFKLVDQPK